VGVGEGEPSRVGGCDMAVGEGGVVVVVVVLLLLLLLLLEDWF
jgi:hypothetical protein